MHCTLSTSFSILIDEFKNNVAQYAIVKKLAAVHHNITVVGDDAQSIYSFRGATIDNILNFERDFPELQTIKLNKIIAQRRP